MTLSTFTMLLDHPQPSSLFPECYHHPKQKLYPLNSNAPFPQHLITSNSAFCLYEVA